MKPLFKTLANGIALVAVLPAVLLYWLAAMVLGPHQAFPGWSQAFSLAPGLIGVYLRRAFYRCVLPRCDTDACVTFGTTFSHPTTCIGRSVYIGAFCTIGDATLEDDVLISSHVSIMNGSRQHGIDRLDVPIREQPGIWPRITIGRDTWIGDHAVIQANVGAHCVIGSGAVVTKPIPDYAIAVGVPAEVVRFRNEVESYEASPRA